MRAREFMKEVDPIQIQLGPDITPELRRYNERGTRDTFDPQNREYGAQDIIGGGAPGVRNIVAKSGLKYGEPPTTLGGRNPATDKDITYAQRKVSQQELDDIRDLGYAVPPVTGTKFSKADQPEKWWSPADAQVQFGRNWNKGDANIRIPMDKLPANRAANREDMQVQDPKTGEWHSMSLKDTPQARYASQWEKSKQNIPGMKSLDSKLEPTNARDAAMTQWMKTYGRPPVSTYGANTTGTLNKEMEKFANLVKDYKKVYPEHWPELQKFKIK